MVTRCVGIVACAVVSVVITRPAFGQGEPVDFQKDVLPVFRQNCIGCHGPDKQMNALRLDRRSAALRGGTQTVIVPGNSASSRLYLRLIGNEFGAPMPPTGHLDERQIAAIKAWIDAGAPWPDDVANEVERPRPSQAAVLMADALRTDASDTFEKLLAANPAALNERGPGGATPLMYAVLYRDAPAIARLLDRGADPNRRDDANATALIWAADSLEKTRVLVEHGAEVNARSDDGRTALFAAATRAGASPIVEYLLDHGATPNPASRSYADSTPLREAIAAADPDMVRLLIARGADVRAAGPAALIQAVAMGCTSCFEMVADRFKPAELAQALLGMSVFGDPKPMAFLLDHGADVNATDPEHRTPLIFASASDRIPVDAVRLLLERGADVNAATIDGATALDYAALHGDTPLVALLTARGAHHGKTVTRVEQTTIKTNAIDTAVRRSLPILQRADVSFMQKTGCISCHNDSFAALSVATARRTGFAVDEPMAAHQVEETMKSLDGWRERMLQGIAQGGGVGTVSYILLGLEAEGHAPDFTTDAAARYIRLRQLPDGRWGAGPACSRPPLCGGEITQTATSLRSLQLYAPAGMRAEYAAAVRLAGDWLAQARSATNHDRAYRLLGLAWARTSAAATEQAKRELLATQQRDGGWSDIATLTSTAYATGLALVALDEAGVAPSDPAYQRGVRFLLNTQLEDGSWHVHSRSVPIQPYFDNGFPHGHDQWISAAATNWATMALARAARVQPVRATASRRDIRQ